MSVDYSHLVEKIGQLAERAERKEETRARLQRRLVDAKRIHLLRELEVLIKATGEISLSSRLKQQVARAQDVLDKSSTDAATELQELRQQNEHLADAIRDLVGSIREISHSPRLKERAKRTQETVKEVLRGGCYE